MKKSLGLARNTKKNLDFFFDYFKKKEKEIKKSQMKQFTWFVVGFVLFYLITTGIVLPFQDPLKAMTAGNAQAMLSVQGIENETIGFTEAIGENAFSFTIINENVRQQVNIIWLCTGILEIIILISAMLASFGVSWKKKVCGAIGAIIVGYVFNLLRVWTTLNIIMTQKIEVIEFSHDLLFRLILFLYIMVFYVAWFYWAAKGAQSAASK